MIEIQNVFHDSAKLVKITDIGQKLVDLEYLLAIFSGYCIQLYLLKNYCHYIARRFVDLYALFEMNRKCNCGKADV